MTDLIKKMHQELYDKLGVFIRKFVDFLLSADEINTIEEPINKQVQYEIVQELLLQVPPVSRTVEVEDLVSQTVFKVIHNFNVQNF